jgi:hypothetical protein
MQATHRLLGLDITELAAIVNACTVVILVFVNAYYLKIAKRQTEAAMAQAKESQRQADAAMENLKLAKAQAQRQAVQELTIVIAMLRGVAADVEFWKAIVKEHWNTAPSTVHLVPEDWPLVVYHNGRVSAELRKKVLDLHATLANANYQITRFLSAPVTSRDPSILNPAYTNLVNLTPELDYIIQVLEDFERSAPTFVP